MVTKASSFISHAAIARDEDDVIYVVGDVCVARAVRFLPNHSLAFSVHR